MEDRETPRMRKYGESKTTRIMTATVPHVTPVRDLENFRPIDFFWQSVRISHNLCVTKIFVTQRHRDSAMNYRLCSVERS